MIVMYRSSDNHLPIELVTNDILSIEETCRPQGTVDYVTLLRLCLVATKRRYTVCYFQPLNKSGMTSDDVCAS